MTGESLSKAGIVNRNKNYSYLPAIIEAILKHEQKMTLTDVIAELCRLVEVLEQTQ